jgi:hypothetical protein
MQEGKMKSRPRSKAFPTPEFEILNLNEIRTNIKGVIQLIENNTEYKYIIEFYNDLKKADYKLSGYIKLLNRECSLSEYTIKKINEIINNKTNLSRLGL